MARTHKEVGPEGRLELVLAMCDHLVSALPIAPFRIEKGGGGNWDDEEIHRIAARIGFELNISPAAVAGLKTKIRDDRGALALIVHLRNALAHGRRSFVECGQDESVTELTSLADHVFLYLEEVVSAFDGYVTRALYLRPELRPAPAPMPD